MRAFQGLQTPTKKPGFYRISRLKSSIFVKNPVSEPPPPSKETGFLPESVSCRQVFRKKPGFWGLATQQRNRVFTRICGW
jgi:hypothetical protein